MAAVADRHPPSAAAQAIPRPRRAPEVEPSELIAPARTPWALDAGSVLPLRSFGVMQELEAGILARCIDIFPGKQFLDHMRLPRQTHCYDAKIF
jgi:hypothetical protein